MREIVVFELLVLACLVSHQSASCKKQVWSCCVEPFVYEEIFLFPTKVCHYLLDIRIEIVAHIYSSFVHCAESLEKRSLVIERFTCVCYEDCRDAESVVNNKNW